MKYQIWNFRNRILTNQKTGIGEKNLWVELLLFLGTPIIYFAKVLCIWDENAFIKIS